MKLPVSDCLVHVWHLACLTFAAVVAQGHGTGSIAVEDPLVFWSNGNL